MLNWLRMKKAIEGWMSRGFRYAFHYREGATLEDALTHRFVATNEAAAFSSARGMHTTEEKFPKVWSLEKELVDLNKQK